MRYLSQHGIRVRRENIENRDLVIGKFLQDNPAIARLWLDPEYAARVMCSHPSRLKVEQIRAAREALKRGNDIATVAQLVGARNIAQIARLASNKTYRRILH